MNIWKKLDIVQDPPVYWQADFEGYYAYEYQSRGGFEASIANQLITNIKKGKNRQGKSDWNYKEQAMMTFARLLSQAVPQNQVIAAIPCSKCDTDPEYYPTGDEVLKRLHRVRRDLKIVRPVRMIETMQSSRKGGTRSPGVIYSNLEWLDGIPPGTQWLYMIDDVLTSGAHFKACRRLVRERRPEVDVCGVFLAKTIWAEDKEEV